MNPHYSSRSIGPTGNQMMTNINLNLNLNTTVNLNFDGLHGTGLTKKLKFAENAQKQQREKNNSSYTDGESAENNEVKDKDEQADRNSSQLDNKQA